MKKLFLALTLLSATAMFAQSTRPFTANLTTACTNATTTCDGTANSQLKFGVGEYSMASITVHGTFTGATLFFEFSDDGGVNWYPTQCTRNDAAIQEGSEAIADSTNRSWDCGIMASGTYRVRLNAISSGTVIANANVSAIQIEPAPTVSLSNSPAIAMSLAGSNQTPITASATGAASAANATLAGAAGKTTYITGFQVTGGGATGASVIAVTVTGTISGTLNYRIVVPAGATASITPLIVTFPAPIPASGTNTAIVVNVPSFGAGNTDAATSVQGFQQ